jgi:hypothetical protein
VTSFKVDSVVIAADVLLPFKRNFFHKMLRFFSVHNVQFFSERQIKGKTTQIAFSFFRYLLKRIVLGLVSKLGSRTCKISQKRLSEIFQLA